jgi:hypothetical protein
MKLNLKEVFPKHETVTSYCIYAFFLFYLTAGLIVVKDFGCGWDERNNRSLGVDAIRIAQQYWGQGRIAEPVRTQNDHGTAFVSVLALIEKSLGISYTSDSDKIHLMMHTVTFIFFFISLIVFYLLCKNYFTNRILAFIGVVFISLHPRIFNHSFHNLSDIPFLSAWIISFYSMLKFLDKRSLRWAVLHAAASAFSVDIRIAGILIPAITGFSFSTTWLKSGTTLRHVCKGFCTLGVYVICCGVFIVLMWPFLWGAPFKHFLWALQSMSHIDWHSTVLYFGELVPADQLPWHYNLVWISITTPPLILASFLVGISIKSIQIVKNPFLCLINEQKTVSIYLWLIIPLIVPVLIGSVLFDEWRHHFFVYPPLVIFSLIGVNGIYEYIADKSKKLASVLICSVSVVFIFYYSYVLMKLHPYENVYFNVLSEMAVGEQEGCNHKFEMDYWGLGYREALQILAKQVPGELRILKGSLPLKLNTIWLSKTDASRIEFLDRAEDAEYLIGTYRWMRGEYTHPFSEEIYGKYIGRTKIFTIRRHDPVAGEKPNWQRTRDMPQTGRRTTSPSRQLQKQLQSPEGPARKRSF